MTDREVLLLEFVKHCGWSDAARTLVAGDASNRRYERLTRGDGTTAILMDAPPEKGENVAPFVQMAEFLATQGLSAPRVFEANQKQGILLIEDLGNDLFARLMKQSPDRQGQLYAAAVDALIALNEAPPPDLPACDADWLISMTDLFFEWYLPKASVLDHNTFAKAFAPLATSVDPDVPVVILRDYHAENLLWLPKRSGVQKVGLLDFQDALLGHCAYDLVSVLQDARRDVPRPIEHEMIARYIAATQQEAEGFTKAYAILGAQRNLRILGIFARLCLRDGKTQYVDLIPRVWGHLTRNLEHAALREIAELILPVAPAPTLDFLKDLKIRCATNPQH